MQKHLPPQSRPHGLFARVIDRFNPGVTMLLGVWLAALVTRRVLLERGALSETGYEAVTSLVYVVPTMLVAWAVLAVADRYLRLGLFRRDDE